MTDDDPKLTPADVAARLGDVSPSFVYAEIERKRLKAHRLGHGKGVFRISEKQFREYLTLTLEKEAPPCPASASSKPAATRPTIKTGSGISRELNALLTPKKRPPSGSKPSSETPRLVSWDTKDDGFSGKH